MTKGKTLLIVGVLGALAYIRYGNVMKAAESFSAPDGESNTQQSVFDKLTSFVKDKFSPSDLETIDKERTGMTVDTLPISYDESSSAAGHLAWDKMNTYVNDAPFGPGVSDVKISAESPYNYNLSAEDFTTFNAVAPGQEIGSATPLKQLHSIQPTTRDPCCSPTPDMGLDLNQTVQMPSDSEGVGSRISMPRLQGKYSSMTLNPNVNDGYTDNAKTQSLAQWRSEGAVDRVNDTTVMFRPHMGGSEKMLRRV